MLIKTLLKGVEIENISNKKLLNENIRDISYDNRDIKNNSVFFAIKGTSFDTHNLLNEISKTNKIKCFILEKEQNITNYIKVKDSRKAFAIASFNYFGIDYFDFIKVGITGTNGKTTIAHIINHIFKTASLNTINIGTNGYYIANNFYKSENTTPGAYELAKLIKRGLYEGANALVMEVSSHALAQHRVAGLMFDVAIFSNLSGDHLDYHKNMENYYNEKKKLFTNSYSKKAVINIDNKYGIKLNNEINIEKLTVSTKGKADIYVKKASFSLKNTIATISVLGKDYDIQTELIGEHNLSNILCSIGSAISVNINIKNILNAINSVTNVTGRLDKIKINGAYFFVDYAHTDDALENVLKSLRKLKKSRIITLFGCGGDRDKTKRPRMAKISEKYSDLVIVTSDNPRTENPSKIINDIMEGFEKKGFVIIEPDRAKAIKRAVNIAIKNDIVLIAGKGHEDYQIIGTVKKHFDDMEELKKLAGVL